MKNESQHNIGFGFPASLMWVSRTHVIRKLLAFLLFSPSRLENRLPDFKIIALFITCLFQQFSSIVLGFECVL